MRRIVHLLAEIQGSRSFARHGHPAYIAIGGSEAKFHAPERRRVARPPRGEVHPPGPGSDDGPIRRSEICVTGSEGVISDELLEYLVEKHPFRFVAPVVVNVHLRTRRGRRIRDGDLGRSQKMPIVPVRCGGLHASARGQKRDQQDGTPLGAHLGLRGGRPRLRLRCGDRCPIRPFHQDSLQNFCAASRFADGVALRTQRSGSAENAFGSCSNPFMKSVIQSSNAKPGLKPTPLHRS